MNIKGEIIAYHGWGFDHHCWDHWQKILATRFQFKAFNRGYFGHELSVEFESQQTQKIIFAHSYGLHLCPLEQLQKAHILILFNSFHCFHPESAKKKKRSQYSLQLMINEFQKNPQNVLEAFRQKCYFPFPCPPFDYDHVNWALLQQDLQALDSTQVNLNLLKTIPKILILHGEKDRIVSSEQTQILAQKLSNNSQYHNIPETGHTLPFTNIKACLPIVMQPLDDKSLAINKQHRVEKF